MTRSPERVHRKRFGPLRIGRTLRAGVFPFDVLKWPGRCGVGSCQALCIRCFDRFELDALVNLVILWRVRGSIGFSDAGHEQQHEEDVAEETRGPGEDDGAEHVDIAGGWVGDEYVTDGYDTPLDWRREAGYFARRSFRRADKIP